MSKAIRKDGELYWPFTCPKGHKFEFGPIHNPIAFESDPDNLGGYRSIPGSGEDEHVPETTSCRVCAEGAGPMSVSVLGRLPIAVKD